MGKIRRSHYTIRLEEYGFHPDRPFRAAVLADLHDRVYRSDVRHVADAVLEEGCELALSAGDLVVMKGGRFACDHALELIEALRAAMPVYLAHGNHETRMARLHPEEYDRYRRKTDALGAVSLVNSHTELLIHDVPVRLTGLELKRKFFKGAPDDALNAARIRRKVGDPGAGVFNILLAHHPKYFPAYAQWGADLTLSGHLHGGIMRLPLLGGVISPDPALFPRYDHGWYRIGKAGMVVSAGLGTHTIHLRINNPAELVILDFC